VKYKLSAMTVVVIIIASATDFIFFCPAHILINHTICAGIKFRKNRRSWPTVFMSSDITGRPSE